jgi:hypothetical protein
MPDNSDHSKRLVGPYYWYISSIRSDSVCQKKKCPNNKKEIYNDKYRHTRDRLFGLHNSRIKFRNRTSNMPKHKQKVAFKIERLILTSLCTYILNI